MPFSSSVIFKFCYELQETVDWQICSAVKFFYHLELINIGLKNE